MAFAVLGPFFFFDLAQRTYEVLRDAFRETCFSFKPTGRLYAKRGGDIHWFRSSFSVFLIVRRRSPSGFCSLSL